MTVQTNDIQKALQTSGVWRNQSVQFVSTSSGENLIIKRRMPRGEAPNNSPSWCLKEKLNFSRENSWRAGELESMTTYEPQYPHHCSAPQPRLFLTYHLPVVLARVLNDWLNFKIFLILSEKCCPSYRSIPAFPLIKQTVKARPLGGGWRWQVDNPALASHYKPSILNKPI